MQRIAVFRALYVGDLLLAVPALRAIRAGFPEAEVTLIGLPWAAGFASRFAQYIDRFLSFPGYPGIMEVPHVREETQLFIEQQVAYGYDWVVQMHGNGTVSNRFVLDLGGRRTVGYFQGARPAGLTVAAPYPDGEPELRRNLGLSHLMGCAAADLTLEFPIFAEERAEAAELLGALGVREKDRLWVGMQPGARELSRRWPPDCFAAVADVLARRHGAQVLLNAARGEEALARRVAASAHTAPLVVEGASLGGLAAVIEQCDLFISNNTGTVQLARALAVPCITIFGAHDYTRWRPIGSPRDIVLRQPPGCDAASPHPCPLDARCLACIEPAAVIAAADQALNSADDFLHGDRIDK
jgi:ADP-heptose:LPS heptosyltransferase